jgi:hypothetical protein
VKRVECGHHVKSRWRKCKEKKQPRRRSSMITHRKKQEIVVQKKKTKRDCLRKWKHLPRFRISKPNHTLSGFWPKRLTEGVPIGKQNDLGQTFLHSFLMLGKPIVKPNTTCWEDYNKFDPTTASDFWLVNHDELARWFATRNSHLFAVPLLVLRVGLEKKNQKTEFRSQTFFLQSHSHIELLFLFI